MRNSQFNLSMAMGWAQLQVMAVAVGLLAGAAPGLFRMVRRRQLRGRLRLNLELAGAVREVGHSAVELDPVLTDLIAANLANLAKLERLRLRRGPAKRIWKLVELVAIAGWALAAAAAVTHVGQVPRTGIGLLVSTVVIVAPVLAACSLALDLFRERPSRPADEVLEKTRDLAEEIVPALPLDKDVTDDLASELIPTIPLGRRSTLGEVLSQRSQLGGRWRTGRASVPPRVEPELEG
jgi:hypothetical protein